jgi:hypothetical protein
MIYGVLTLADLAFVLGLSGGIVMAVAAWREARRYARAQESMCRISRRSFRESSVTTERDMSDFQITGD